MNHSNHFDIIIIGGGLVGLTFAGALGGSALSIAIIEEKEVSGLVLEDRYSTYVSAITRASQRIFENIGIWSTIQAARLSPYTKMCVWETGNTIPLWFDSAELNAVPPEENLGNIVENQLIHAALIDKLKTYSNISWVCPAKLRSLEYLDESIKVSLADGREITADLLVGADGANSWVRQQVAIATTSWDYGHHAIVTNVRTEMPHGNTAWQCFLQSGPLAFLPLPDPHCCSIVWSTSPEHAKTLSKLPTDAFQKELAMSFEYRLGTLQVLDKLTLVPLRMTHAQQYVRPKVALIGDAAHTLHPLAGQGVNLGLLDAATLAELVLNAHYAHKKIGSLILLRRYERWRKGHNLAMISVMEGFKRVFENENILVKWARRTGMQLIDSLPAAKELLISHAMGIRGNLPRLAKL